MTALAGRDQLGLGGRPGAGGKYKYRGCEGPNSVVGARLQGAPGRPFQKGGSDGEAATGAPDILEGFPGLPGTNSVVGAWAGISGLDWESPAQAGATYYDSPGWERPARAGRIYYALVSNVKEAVKA